MARYIRVYRCPDEEWKINEEYPTYLISNLGRVQRNTGRMLNGTVNKKGYRQFGLLSVSGVIKTVLCNRLVAETFIGPAPTIKHEAAHQDGNRLNNRLDNLRWATRQENEDDKELHGTRPRGELVYNSRLTIEAVKEIRASCLPEYALAKMYGVSRGAINKARSGENWRHVDA